ncbi:hypothetical protein JHK87_019264 [Glycine soja]|nr:hypothetical protein JHK87_019264 [Glycine soja]
MVQIFRHKFESLLRTQIETTILKRGEHVAVRKLINHEHQTKKKRGKRKNKARSKPEKFGFD